MVEVGQVHLCGFKAFHKMHMFLMFWLAKEVKYWRYLGIIKMQGLYLATRIVYILLFNKN